MRMKGPNTVPSFVVRFLAWLAQLLGLYEAGILLTTAATLVFLCLHSRLPQPLQRFGRWVCWLPLTAAAALMTYGSVQSLAIFFLLRQQDALSDAQSWRLVRGMFFGWVHGFFWGGLATFCLRWWYARSRGLPQVPEAP